MSVTDTLTLFLEFIGSILLLLGCFFEFIGAVGVLRLPNFFTRAHATTSSAMGGTVVPLIGLSLISLAQTELGWGRIYVASLCLITAILILIIAPAGTHAITRAAWISEINKRKNSEKLAEETRE